MIDSPQRPDGAGDVDLFHLFLLVARYRRLVLGLPAAVALATALVVLLMPNVYTGTARVVVAQQQSGVTALLSQFGGAGPLASGMFGLKNPAELYVGMLQSRSVADALIERFQLAVLYDEDTMEETREALAYASEISSSRDGIIVIAVQDEDAARAAAMANAYVEELERISQNLAVTEAAQRRLFFERQLVAAKNQLADSEVALKLTQEETGLIQLDGQAQVIISALAALRAQIAAKQVQLGAIQAFATARNAEFVRAQEELAGLRKQLENLERSRRDAGMGDFLVSASKVPGVGLEYVRKLRDVKYHEALFELLAKQFELAKIDEAHDAAVIQVLDRAVATDKKSRPRRALIVLLAAAAAGFLGLLAAFTLDFFDRSPLTPAQRRRLLPFLRLCGAQP